MCGPTWADSFRRSLFIETQAFVENKVHFKLGAIFAADRAVSLECWNKLTVKPRHVLKVAQLGKSTGSLWHVTNHTNPLPAKCSSVPASRARRDSKKRLLDCIDCDLPKRPNTHRQIFSNDSDYFSFLPPARKE